MSRLIEILNEEVSATINGKQYKFHTDAGNLFRLMLAVNPDHPIPQEGSQNIVSKMLPDLLEQKEKEVKKLQTAFNKIKKIAKSGKKPSTVVKKEYFAILFSLMLPLTSQANFKPASLTNNFSAGSENAYIFQRKATVLIGKSLLKNQDIDLNTKDRQLIAGYIMGLEELDDTEKEAAFIPNSINPEKATKVEVEEEIEQPQNAITSVVNSEKTIDELNATIAQTEAVITEVKKKNEINDISIANTADMLKTNTTSDTFKVNFEGTNDAEVAPILNAKLESFYQNTLNEYGQETANFATKFISDTFKNLNGVGGYLNFLKDDINFEITKTGSGFDIISKVGTEGVVDDEHRFFMSRKFKVMSDGSTEVYNDRLQIPESLQGTGINKKIFKDGLDLYKAKGVKRITLQANVDVGGYAWFRYGFVPQDNFQISGISQWMRDVSPVVADSLQYDAQDVADFILKQSYTKSAGIENLAALMRTGKNDKSEKVIKTLFSKCADEFADTFNDKAKFKELGQKIANMNFKEYKIGGTTYSISYKALLSIQALNVDGFKPVPMSSYHGDIHLGWMGELDMNDLENTYAYLNL
jgi:hypothetical protein